eukprot:TRINITY_DN7818_c0_g1_i1.p1 TRINITY_DN7818_c0_g1~~TRINITY_DN7818_c0_g1_i1.p1  ORF type:complete len:354 (-),score=61.99 TRINITY_DN7818_c0_g1_i1:95-1156(-)
MEEDKDEIIEVFATIPKDSKPSTSTETKTEFPSKEISVKLIEQFVETTKTDERVARFYLEQFDWDLQVAVPTFFKEFEDVKATSVPSPELTNRFSLITWNVDGLSRPNLKIRVKAVCKIIEKIQVDIVFLQEVIPQTLTYFKEKLPNYLFIHGNEEGDDSSSLEYFTIICLRRSRITLDSFQVIPYEHSVMGRNLQLVEARFKEYPLILLNTHLESTKEHASTRIQQLQQCISVIQEKASAAPRATIIFGGDLNVRDSEVGDVPSSLHDLWIANGSRKECKYTWDMMRNTNLQFEGRFKPRLRFDRLYIKYNENKEVVSDFFGLLGIEKITGTQSFPSDHWGILTRFQIKSEN